MRSFFKKKKESNISTEKYRLTSWQKEENQMFQASHISRSSYLIDPNT